MISELLIVESINCQPGLTLVACDEAATQSDATNGHTVATLSRWKSSCVRSVNCCCCRCPDVTTSVALLDTWSLVLKRKMSTLDCLLMVIYFLSANRNVLDAAPRLLCHRQLLGGPFDPSPNTASSADTPRSISECRDVKLEGGTLSAACLEALTQTVLTLAVDVDTCIATVKGILTYSAA
jgi:hypothetical protein